MPIADLIEDHLQVDIESRVDVLSMGIQGLSETFPHSLDHEAVVDDGLDWDSHVVLHLGTDHVELLSFSSRGILQSRL